MGNLREEVDEKLGHVLHDIKDLQKTIIRLKRSEKAMKENRISKWLHLGKEISAKWEGPAAVDEIRIQRGKSW